MRKQVILLGALFLVSIVGTIILLEFSKPVQNFAKTIFPKNVVFNCTGDKASDWPCYETYYETLALNQGLTRAFEDVKLRYEGNGYVKSMCHPIAHVLGHAGAKMFQSVGEAYTHGDSFCWSGYYHGVMEEISDRIGFKNLAASMDSICADIPGKKNYTFDYYNCVHGLGHGVMTVNDNELFEGLKICDALTGQWEKESCYGGAFMENVMVDNRNHFSKYLKSDDLVYPCNAVDTPYKQSCYLMQTSYMLTKNGGNFVDAFKLCRTLGDKGFIDTCFQSLGRDASGRTISDTDATIVLCNLGTNYNEKFNCIMGAVKDFISYLHDDTRAKELCAEASKDLQLPCLGIVETYYKSFK